eukprot:scaffold1201_cov413-Prasinococcus_capsulatus_cf.AAC.2
MCSHPQPPRPLATRRLTHRQRRSRGLGAAARPPDGMGRGGHYYASATQCQRGAPRRSLRGPWRISPAAAEERGRRRRALAVQERRLAGGGWADRPRPTSPPPSPASRAGRAAACGWRRVAGAPGQAARGDAAEPAPQLRRAGSRLGAVTGRR